MARILVVLTVSACWTSATTTPQAPVAANDEPPRAAVATNAELGSDAVVPPPSTPAPQPAIAATATAPSTGSTTAAPAADANAATLDVGFTTPTTVASAEPSTSAEATAVAPDEPERSRGWYTGGGALYLPIDDGFTAASAIGGVRLMSGPLEARFGARLSYGESKYSSAVVVTGESQIIRWFGVFGLGAVGGVGAILASQKLPGGWDGLMPGIMLVGSARMRFGSLEPSFDLGTLYAVGADATPFGLLSLTGRM